MAHPNAGVFDFAEIKKRLGQIGERELISRPVESYQASAPIYGSPAWVCSTCLKTTYCNACLYGD